MAGFKNIILLGRPASGKSEFIDFLKKTPVQERQEKFHVGNISELDDFLWLWEKFVEDDIWEAAGFPRRCSKKVGHGYVVSDGSILDFCFAKFNAEYPKQPKDGTLFVEFARGAADGGYQHALSSLSDAILKDAAILFIYASYEESCRRNDARFQEKLKHSVLAHKVPEEDMIRFGKEIDWLTITQEKSAGHLKIRNHNIPFVTMNNEPELKPGNPDLEVRYKTALDQLMKLKGAQ
ncbi:MAG: hypothetical protein Q7T03_00120 [Deltaproteobacteria bacterium]|nr:hypothetical protein [Deltaproteobacteria bacterium]